MVAAIYGWTNVLGMGLAHLSEMQLVCLSLHEDGVMYVMSHLIWGNPSINPHLPLSRLDFDLMNGAQRAVAALDAFDSDVENGGIGQFIFNHPSQLPTLLEALPLMGWPSLEREVNQALRSLDPALLIELAKARNIWTEDLELNERWAAFRTWLEKFDGDAFDDWFYDHTDEYRRRLMQLVWRRRAELITGG
ncbi:MAG TPA: DUF4375 domain-containing protein [Hyphomonadaceae bacterium]|nr:DUF4375 domain-containing protein [Hyphomonadaceae bacterium]